MKVILTHTAADFDAIASLLAMHKLEPDAIPVLPQSVNHNVAQFLLLYDRQWDMLEAENLPRSEKVEIAFVVDTQAFNMVRGMYPETPVYIIDHHPQGSELPDHFTYTGDATGANVTLLVEKIAERGIKVDALEATLFLLGIYEDTGSLAYKSTTPRDLHAAAWLLQNGADLDLAREFIHHAMNDAQTALFERLQDTAESITVKGHTIMLTSAVLDESVNEAAVVAHELLDMFGCDALFLMMQVKDNVQIIARSVVDNIDVGAVIRHFHGSGHHRAAAALVRDAVLSQVIAKIKELLPQHTIPALRVRDLMSWGVQWIDSRASAADAQTQMLETGHEGYPVLENGKLIGLLTRRAVDRAVLHDLHKLPVTEIMEAGTYAVSPDDAADALKEKMLATGWGQMPVVDAENKLIGIVTRTDLIKQWGQRPTPNNQFQTILHKLQTALSPGIWALLQAISHTAEEQHIGLYMVGGIVRDLLLARPNLDIDLVVEGDAIALARKLCEMYGGDMRHHQQFGTAKWLLNEQVIAALGFQWDPQTYPAAIDFATSRAEFYEAPTVLPTVRRGSIKLDLHRRDFTINALAIRLAPPPTGALLDFYNGERDLENGIIRVLHSLSFIDDPTRIIRAVRFEQRFGFQIEPRTEELIRSALSMLSRVSGDRIRSELNLILAESTALQALERLDALGVLGAIHPALQLDDTIRGYFVELQKVRRSPPWRLPDDFDNWRILAFALLTAHMSSDELENLIHRLLISRMTADHLRGVHQGLEKLPQIDTMSPSEVVKHFEKLGETCWLALWVMSKKQTRATLEKLARQWQYITPRLDGNALMAMGLKPGPLIGEILDKLRTALLDGDIETEDDERSYAQRHIQKRFEQH